MAGRSRLFPGIRRRSVVLVCTDGDDVARADADGGDRTEPFQSWNANEIRRKCLIEREVLDKLTRDE